MTLEDKELELQASRHTNRTLGERIRELEQSARAQSEQHEEVIIS